MRNSHFKAIAANGLDHLKHGKKSFYKDALGQHQYDRDSETKFRSSALCACLLVVVVIKVMKLIDKNHS